MTQHKFRFCFLAINTTYVPPPLDKHDRFNYLVLVSERNNRMICYVFIHTRNGLEHSS